MTRLFLVTFGVLGWAWYELSGGSDFEPGYLTKAGTVETQELETVARADTGAIGLKEIAPDTAKVDVITAPEVVTGTDTAPDTAPVIVASEDTDVTPLAQEASTLVALDETSVTESPAVLETAALETGIMDSETVVEEAPVQAIIQTRRDITPAPEPLVQIREDVREVTGTRVNMRSGPGTGFNVVSRLRKGDQVTVLGANADGWLEVMAIETGEQGWMADFLLTASN